ncbi:MarR family transcriptional regulator [Planococcus sp. CP5-4]|uniref:MarR family winged helix-turn-helix transcriptional regulator n=1 Tax=unclassified Planococcus (in: firmicutes) TaxID=2662419 RepID=UPI001C20F7BA|nr:MULTISPECIES: MarR family transcriptional regulator [unclassified Planococcus (in: firmicutes)]MBU9673776.1 MarR family transcriptional regulator [Planococcus sp. CP5-4_YE]MBV0908904.1 MarR family transcriptional regulator [Planococcus sp. CP5-4_UN]MBW6063953.1 MarR family transcriptional regulator [Planococcus sp. CP5-4]
MKVENEIADYMQLMLSFAEVQKSILRIIQKSTADKGMSMPQYSILMTLFRGSDMTQKTIAEKTFLPKSTLSQAVDGMVKDGYVARQPMECDRREMCLELSEAGLALAQELHIQEDGLHQLFRAASAQFTERQIEELIAAHRKISSYLTKSEMEGAVK